MTYEYDDEQWGPPEQNPGHLATPLTASELTAATDQWLRTETAKTQTWLNENEPERPDTHAVAETSEDSQVRTEIKFWDAHYGAATDEAEADGS